MESPGFADAPPSFREVQALRSHPIVWIGCLGAVAGCVAVAFPAWVGGLPSLPSVLMLVLFLAVAGILLFGELRTEVREQGLCVHFFPLTARHCFRWDEIRSSEARSYRPIAEFGGWGVRYGRGGKAYNVRGKRGVQLEFASGKRLLIGSQHADELALAIEAQRSRR